MKFDFRTLPSSDAYKLMTGTILPRPIAWVVTQNPLGQLNCAPFSFFNAVGADPPLVSLGINNRPNGHRKDSGSNILSTGQLTINLVPFAMAEQMNITAIEFPPEIDEVEQAGLTMLPSECVTPPRIQGCPVSFECELAQAVTIAPSKTLILARILLAHISDSCVLDRERCHIDAPALDLIGRMHGGGYYTRTSEVFKVDRIPVQHWQIKGASGDGKAQA